MNPTQAIERAARCGFVVFIVLAISPAAMSDTPAIDAVVSDDLDPALTERGWQLLTKKRTPVTGFRFADGSIQINVASSKSLIYRLPGESEPTRFDDTGSALLMLTWDWRVESVSEPTRGGSAAGKDPDWPVVVYAAFAVDSKYQSWWRRMMNRVVFGVAGLPASGNVLTYVWQPAGSDAAMYPNPYIPKTGMIFALPAAEQGGWQTHQRNLYEDFAAAFGYPPAEVLYLAVSADGEDAGVTSRALLKGFRLER